MFLSLDYIYSPCKNIEESVKYYTEILGGSLVWKIHNFGAWVACIRLSETGPHYLLADHLDSNEPILVYQVANINKTVKELEARGWKSVSGRFSIPNGPCYTFTDPAGVHLAIYENIRPEVDKMFRDSIDKS